MPHVAAVLSLVLMATLVGQVPAAADPRPSPGGKPKSVPVRAVKPRAAVKSATDGPGIRKITAARFPRAGSAMVAVSGVDTQVGDLPVALAAPAASPDDDPRRFRSAPLSPAAARVKVLDRTVAKAAGVSGVLLTVARADGRDIPGRVSVRVDYRQFANVFGADVAGRLRMVELPACAVSTPKDARCRAGRDLEATRSAGALAADVTLTGTATATVLALTAGSSSAGATFDVTSLSGAYSWSAGNQAGAFTYSYPIPVPPAGVGPQPNLALTYNSGLVDGQTNAANGQASWVGEGWDLQVGYVERSYRPCEQDSAPTLSGDLCWFSPNNATLMFGGQALPLVFDATNGWRTAKDDGLRVEKLTDRPYIDNGDSNLEYWRVTTQDGTQYFFGVNKRYSNDNENTRSVQTVPVYGDDPTDPCANSFCREAYRWNLDYVIDPRGNTMTYVYNLFQGRYGASGLQYELAANLDHIDYGDVAGTEHSQNAPMRVQFDTANRCAATCTDTDYAQYPDTPWDLYCAAGQTCSSGSPAFFNNKKLSAISAMVWDPVDPPKYRTVDRWVLTQTFPDSGDNIAPAGPDTPPNLWLQSIQHTGYGADGTTLSESQMQFGGERRANRVGWGGTMPPYMHYRLTSIRTSTGGQTLVSYTNTTPDGVACDGTWTPAPDGNPYLCFPQYHKPEGAAAGYGWFYKYLVTTVTERDLTGQSPDEISRYLYSNAGSSDSALWAHDFNENVQLAYRTWSLWRGFSTVVGAKKDNSTEMGPQSWAENVYFRGMDGDSKTTGDGTGVSWYNRDAALLTPIGTPGLDTAISGQGGKCLDVKSSGTANGTAVQLWTCNHTGAQVWKRQENGSWKNPNSGKCLDISGGATAAGTPLVIWDCIQGAWSQIWQPQPLSFLKNPQSARCMEVSGKATASGTPIVLSTCTNAWNRVWQPQPDGSLMNPQHNRCIDVSQGGTANGTVIQSWECNNSGSQTWRLRSDGSLLNPQSGKCADVKTSGTTNGTPIQLYDCNNTGAQVWRPLADGSLQNPQSGKCLEAATNTTTGSPTGQLVLWDCISSTTGKWQNRINDADGLDGFLQDSRDYNGPPEGPETAASDVLRSTVHVPATTRTATRAAPPADVGVGQEMRAHRVTETATKSRTKINATGTWRWTESQASYDPTYGLPIDVQDLGDTAVTTDDTCIHTDYARNTAAYMVGYPSQVTEYAGSCGSTSILSQARTYYDADTLTLGTPPTKGLRTRTRTLTTAPDVWADTFAIYDGRGRSVSNTDARGQVTTTTYTPTDNLPLKEAKVINPLGHTSTVTFDPGRGQPIQIIDPNGKLTQIEYDPLGRRTAVWLPTEKKVNGDPPSQKYTYDISAAAPNKLTTQVLQTGGATPVYLTSFDYLDGRLRARNTQTTAPDGTGRTITETRYDSRGHVRAVTAPFYNASAAGTGLVTAADTDIPSQTTYSYDGLDRLSSEDLVAAGVFKWSTTHTYDGDRHTLLPPSGGETTTVFDALGRTTKTIVHPTGTTTETTSYGYSPAGNLATVTDPAGNITRYGYNLAGQRTSVQDPDTGSSTSTYNPAGDLTSTTDANTKKVSFAYDVLGRLKERWSGDVTTGTKLATYTYDGVGSTGYLASTTRHTSTGDYVVAPTGYDDRYRPTGVRWTIPTGEGNLAGTYTTTFGYDAADHLTTIAYPARAGLPAETVTTGYDNRGYATTLTGAGNYVTATGYSGTGQLSSRNYGDAGPGQLIRTYGWEADTGRLSRISATLPDPAVPGTRKTVEDDSYQYLPAGDISSIKDVTDGQSQCYRYDGVHRLTEAFTATDNCVANPGNVAASGKLPYWDSYTFDTTGRRATDSHRTATSTTTRTYNYPATGQPHVHGANSITVTGATSRTDNLGYDPAGNVQTRTIAGVTSTYTTNAEGRFAGATVGTQQTSHVYDADGALLIRSDPTGKTLYLGSEELKLTGNTVTGTRYYSHDGAVVAARTGTGLAWLTADHQTSANLTVDTANGTVQRRWYTPYGADRNTVTGWPTNRGFLNAPANSSTKLLDVGAREYDPDTGTFIAPDPLVDPGDPATLNPYAYANHNPITLSDPTGLAAGTVGWTPDQLDNATGEKLDPQTTETLVVAAEAVLVTVGTVVLCGTGVGCLVSAAIVGASVGVAGYTAPPGQRVRAATVALLAAAAGGAAGAGARLLTVRAGVAATSRTAQGVAGAAAGITESATYQYATTRTVDWRQLLLAGAAGGTLGAAVKPTRCTTHSCAPAERMLTSLSEEGRTAGVLDLDGELIPLVSGKSLLPNYAASGHVEGQAALIMRERGATIGRLLIDNPNGICGYCTSQVATLLPKDAVLEVATPLGTVPPSARWTTSKTFIGNAADPKRWPR